MNIDAETVRALIGKLEIVSDPGRLVNDVPLNQQGMDSLDFVNLLFRFEEEYNVKLPDSDVDGVRSIDDIVSLMNRKLGEQ
jgi:acyl carrier protein